MTITRRQLIQGSALLCAAPTLRAQGEKPVRLILPVSAGSGVDAIVRAATGALAQALGQPVVVDNQPGAGGVVGTQALVKAAPDGLTLSFVSNNHVIYPSVVRNLAFDPIADITPIAVVGATPMVLVTHPRIVANDLKEFAALLKASPGRYNYASSGNGTILHLAAELFKDLTGTYSTHIPYRGFGPMLQDIIGGQVDWGVGALPAVKGSIASGRLKALAIASPRRSPAAPEIPTSAEASVPGYLVDGWFALVGPKGLEADKVARLHAALTQAFNSADVRDAMARQGNMIDIRSPADSLAHFRSEMNRYAGLIRKAGMTAQ